MIPELVDADLLNEHLARYRFANRIAGGMEKAPRVLDAGCGAGYGTAELTCAASVTATDIAADAVGHAERRYGRPGVRFLRAACEALPFRAGAFDLVTAFEVIEHIERWRELISEADRVLAPGGILLVSTPNRDYYEESRGDSGPNPFHVHEFDYAEFRQALEAVFPHVRIWVQNHAGAVVFSPQEGAAAGGGLDAEATGDTGGAHFYFAACSRAPIAENEVFAWLPASANILRERERHIAKLSDELEKKNTWLRQNIEAQGELLRRHDALLAELKRRTEWAGQLDRELAARDERIAGLQGEMEERLAWVADLEDQLLRAREEMARLEERDATRLAWIADLEAQIGRGRHEIARLTAEASEIRAAAQASIDRLEETVSERTLWARNLDAEVESYRAELRRIAASRWVRAGMKLGIGPRVRDGR